MDEGFPKRDPFFVLFPLLPHNSCLALSLPIPACVTETDLAAKSRVPEFADMASMTMTASHLPNSSSTLTKLPSTTARRGFVAVKSSSEKASLELKNVEMREVSNGRRELIFAAAAAAACSIAKVAMADEEPKAGTPEAKKNYAPICVTMPTARICHK